MYYQKPGLNPGRMKMLINLLKPAALLLVLFVVQACTPENDPPPPKIISLSGHLVAHWSFDSDVGNEVMDMIDNNYPGTLHGTEKVNGPVQKAYNFDGLNDFIEINVDTLNPEHKLHLLDKGSISLWFNCDTIPQVDGIAPIFYYGSSDSCAEMPDAANQGIVIEIGHSPIHQGSKRLYFTVFADGCNYPPLCFDTNFPIEQDQWYHLVIVIGDNTNNGYINGFELIDRNYNFGNSSMSLFFSDAVKHDKIMIGRGFWDAKEVFFDGIIDDIRIYNKDITHEEVNYLFNLREPSIH